ncbi:unnamed protein product [Heterobilharzia americana]|nr:unnamed protein product [Heterobilharzia americana]
MLLNSRYPNNDNENRYKHSVVNISFISVEAEFDALNNHQLTLSPPINITLKINSKLIDFELDTGSPVTICSGQYWFKVFGHSAYKDLEEAHVRLKTYTGESLCILGFKNVVFEYKNHATVLTIYIARGSGPNLLGRDWLFKVINFQNNSKHDSLIIDQFLAKYSHVFDKDSNVEKTKSIKVLLPIADSVSPKYYKPHTLKNTLKYKVEMELKRLQSEGIIESVQFSTWATPIIPILKSDNNVHIYGDYKITLNNYFAAEKKYMIPTIEEVYQRLCGRNTSSKYFSKLNATCIFQQLQLDDKSKVYTTITTHKGLYQYKYLPYGINCNFHIFYEVFDTILAGIPNAVAYLGDILIGSETVDEHLTIIRLILTRLQEYGLHLKKDKCSFLIEHLEYIGYRLDCNGLHLLSERILPILDLPQPSNIHELKSFLALFSYFAQYNKDNFENIEHLTQPLNELLVKNVEWRWDKTEVDCFQKIKEILIGPKVLTEFDPEKTTVLLCNASAHGIGAILTQCTNHLKMI